MNRSTVNVDGGVDGGGSGGDQPPTQIVETVRLLIDASSDWVVTSTLKAVSQ